MSGTDQGQVRLHGPRVPRRLDRRPRRSVRGRRDRARAARRTARCSRPARTSRRCSACARCRSRRRRGGTPTVPPEIDDIVMTALERDPDSRWQHATALRNALTTLTKRLGMQVTNQEVVAWLDALDFDSATLPFDGDRERSEHRVGDHLDRARDRPRRPRARPQRQAHDRAQGSRRREARRPAARRRPRRDDHRPAVAPAGSRGPRARHQRRVRGGGAPLRAPRGDPPVGQLPRGRGRPDDGARVGAQLDADPARASAPTIIAAPAPRGGRPARAPVGPRRRHRSVPEGPPAANSGPEADYPADPVLLVLAGCRRSPRPRSTSCCRCT